MWFLVKCCFWLAVVFLAIGGRGAAPPDAEPHAQVAKPREREAPIRSPPSVAQKSQSASVGRGGDLLSDLADQAAAKLAGAARDQCLAHPVDCLHTVERLGQAAAKAEPARR